MSININSVLRYPGGKRRMLAFLQGRLPLPNEINGRYIEPFVGGGAVFFYLQPRVALLSDANPELIDIYRGIRRDPKNVWEIYTKFGNTKKDYHYIRDQVTGETVIERAARMLYLNRTCFKGMWRQNQRGNFNVGYGGESRRWVITKEDLFATRRLLRRAKIRCGDFEKVIDEAVNGDFLFLDPPYRPGAREHLNDHYIWQQFSFEDHQRLASALRRAKHRGVIWAMTTTAHLDIIVLFRTNYAQDILNGTGKMPGISAKDSGEVFISSYKSEGSKRL